MKALLAGSISALGSHYVITLEAINAQSGDAMAREQVEADSKEQVLKRLGEAATKLREQLGESLASIQKFDAPIEQATTSSLEAFKAYTLGREQHLKGKYLEAIPLYKRATDLDPNFALGYARLSAVYVNSRQFGLAAEASQKAYDLRNRVSERERLVIAANYYDDVTKEVEKKIETFELWKRTYPFDFQPHNNLALQYNNLGEYEKAVDEAREAISHSPHAAPAHSNLATALIGLNRLDEAKEVIDRALAQKLETVWMHRNLYLIAFVRGDAATMKQQIEWAKGKPDEYAAQRWQAETAAFSGQLRKANEFSDRAVELALRRDLTDVAAEITAGGTVRNALFGECDQIEGQTAKALATTQSYWTRFLAATALAACGEFSRTQSITDEMLKRYPKDTLLSKLFLPLIQAQSEMYRGNAAQVIQLLERTTPYERTPLPFPIAYVRGQAYLSQHKGAEAAAEFQKILDHTGVRGWPADPVYPLAHVGLARASVLQGDTAKARKIYENFLAFWKDADADLPILIEARKEYQKLK
jgi:tetratricopeptide (TPR) repeat protein